MRIKSISAVIATLTIALCSHVGAQETLDSSVSHLPGGHDLAHNTMDGSFLVAWAGENAGAGHKMEIRAHRLVPSGKITGSMIALDMSHLMSTEVAVAYGEGKYFVVWRDGRSSSSVGDEVYGRMLDSSGNLLGDSFRISDLGDKGPDRSPDVTFDGEKFLVVWAHRNLPPSGGGFTVSFVENDDIRGRYVTLEGTMDEASFAFTTEAVDSLRPSVATLSGTPLTVWEDHPGPGMSGQVWGRFTPQQAPHETSFPYSVGAGITKEAPCVVADPDAEQYLVLWRAEDVRDGDVLFARLASAEGKYIGDPRVIQGVSGGVHTFSAAYDATRKEYLVSWDVGVKETAGHICAVRLDSKNLGTKSKIQITEGETRNWGVVSDPTGEGAPLSVYLREGEGENVELVSGRLLSAVLSGGPSSGGGGSCSASATRSTPSPIPFLVLSLLVVLLLFSPLIRNRSDNSSS